MRETYRTGNLYLIYSYIRSCTKTLRYYTLINNIYSFLINKLVKYRRINLCKNVRTRFRTLSYIYWVRKLRKQRRLSPPELFHKFINSKQKTSEKKRQSTSRCPLEQLENVTHYTLLEYKLNHMYNY